MFEQARSARLSEIALERARRPVARQHSSVAFTALDGQS
jgi:hypothetical protein